ncbi:MAG: GNAT family N-acetyltransferase [Candidatus Limnocylindrales bacterium]|jgi:ribosomal protein S18 acetylase RimI-like enzyme
MALPDPAAPFFGLDAETLRFIEAHQVRAVTIPGRGWRDMGDAVMLFSATESEPFFNRLVAVRWPSDPGVFDARLREACELFTALERRPYVWAVPGLSEPDDLVARLAANGFVDQGGGYDMVLVREPGAATDRRLPAGSALEHWNRSTDQEIPARAEALASVIADAFDIPAGRHSNLVREIGLTLGRPDFHAYMLTVDGEPVATGQRYTFDGASYISSIGTRPGWRGRGLGAHITRVLAVDSLADGVDLIYLGVYADNTAAIRLYERLGFSILGGRSADMLQTKPK